MKKLLSILVLATTGFVGYSQNNPVVGGLVTNAIDFFSQGSNYMVATYGIYDEGNKSFGGGVGVGYKLNDMVVPTMRLDYINSQLWMPSASLQLQLPVTILGKFTAIPFAFPGIATPVGGSGKNNGQPVGIFGAGMAIQITKHFDLIGDVEKWSISKGQQYRFGVVYKF